MQKKIFLLVSLALVVVSTFTSCKRKTRVTERTDLSIKMNTTCNGSAISPGLMNNTNAAGQNYSVDLLKYYISKIVLHNEDGTKVNLNNYDLIDINTPGSAFIAMPSVPLGHYTSITLNLGIDSSRNHEGAQEGDLDPLYGMIWTWNTGYIFYKHEGKYKINDSTTGNLVFHLGTDRAYSTTTIPIDWKIEENSTANTLHLDFDINKMYNNPAVDFTVDNNRMSTSAIDSEWIDKMKSNINDAFSFSKVE